MKRLTRSMLSKALLICCLALGMVGVARAGASDIFKDLAGSWRGIGTLTLTDGSRQRLSCQGYYVLKSAGKALSIAILCRSTEQKIEIRGQVEETARGISGRWEERTYNATGDLSGRAAGRKLNLSISGGVEGSIVIALSGRRQVVEISTRGTGFTGVSISLNRG